MRLACHPALAETRRAVPAQRLCRNSERDFAGAPSWGARNPGRGDEGCGRAAGAPLHVRIAAVFDFCTASHDDTLLGS